MIVLCRMPGMGVLLFSLDGLNKILHLTTILLCTPVAHEIFMLLSK